MIAQLTMPTQDMLPLFLRQIDFTTITILNKPFTHNLIENPSSLLITQTTTTKKKNSIKSRNEEMTLNVSRSACQLEIIGEKRTRVAQLTR